MRNSSFAVIALLLAVALCAAETPRPGPAKLKPPKGVTLTPDQQKLLDEANAIVERGYGMLMDKHDPGLAVEELRKAIAIMNQLAVLKGEQQLAGVAPGNEKGTPFDEIKAAGSIEKIVEIGAAMGVTAPDEVDNGLYKRKIIEDAKETVKKIDAEQKKVTQQLQAMAGAAGGEEQKQQQADQQAGQQQADQQNQAQAGQQPQNQAQAGQQADQQNQGQAGQQQAGAEGGQQPQPDAKTELAGKEEGIARELNKLATKLAETGPQNGQPTQAQQAFRKAAGEATKTADLIRQGEVQNAAAASKQVERAIQNALHEAGLAGEGALAAAVSAIERQLGKMQAGQQELISKSQQLGKSADGTPAPERVKQERAQALAVEQGRLKPQVEEVQRAIEDLARPAGGEASPARTTENAARAELASAAAEMQKNRPKQAVVNAAMKLAQGDAQAATKSMSQVQSALDAAQQRVTAAESALASGDASRLESAYRAVQQLAASARRLEQTALTAAGQQGQTQNAERKTENGQPDAKGQEKGATGQQPTADQKAAAKAQEHAGDGHAATPDPQAATNGVSPSWGQVLNKSAEQLGGETGRIARRLEHLVPETSKQLGAAASGVKTAFERDFPRSLEQVRTLLRSLEKAEQELGAKVAKEKEGKALRNYRKEDIPRAYREAVAAYYEELSKEEKK